MHCYRCNQEFTSELAVKMHLKELQPCQVSLFREPTGFGKDVEKVLRGKNRSRDQSDVEKWKDIYSVLFPDVPSDQIPEPCERFHQLCCGS